MYLASGGVIFVREHQPITLQKARLIENIHRMNAAYQLSQNDERSLTARLALAKAEQSLADEMAAAIREATEPQEIAA
jgi:RNA polymerase-interacting CarD/CdnL/TRCF family regulator